MYKSFKEMPVWKDAMAIAVEIFSATKGLPKYEEYGFTSQIRRAALSMSANIAEAYGRKHKKDKVNFYHIALGSSTETQSHIEYGRRVKYFTQENADALNKKLEIFFNDINKVIRSLEP